MDFLSFDMNDPATFCFSSTGVARLVSACRTFSIWWDKFALFPGSISFTHRNERQAYCLGVFK